jgi:hypothetical protein
MSTTDPKVVKALKKSIESWKKRATNGRFNEPTAAKCALCHLFNLQEANSNTDMDCEGCPVYEKTHSKYCGFTPVANYMRMNQPYHTSEDRKTVAKSEVKFLESLL